MEGKHTAEQRYDRKVLATWGRSAPLPWQIRSWEAGNRNLCMRSMSHCRAKHCILAPALWVEVDVASEPTFSPIADEAHQSKQLAHAINPHNAC